MTEDFQPGTQVVVTADYHLDHGRHGVVVSLNPAAPEPIGVLLGMGLSAIVHYFRFSELAVDGADS